MSPDFWLRAAIGRWKNPTERIVMRASASVQLTKGQANAILAALAYFLTASTDDEQLIVFGSGPGVAAAQRVEDKIVSAFHA